MRQLHLLGRSGDTLARDVIERQVRDGDEVRVVLTGEAAETDLQTAARVMAMPPLQYDALVELLTWSERVVSW
ncbi:MAG: hypothetical protein M3010_11110 [Candidatus Dormibacteraeota bacterium]|nr:hypothetical protein [Candidatus Dormibacteraeota bacterium]